MRKIDKFLSKLDSKQRKAVLAVLVRLRTGNVSGLDLRKLKGASDKYRVRIGNVRIIFTMDNGDVSILQIGYRNDTTY